MGLDALRRRAGARVVDGDSQAPISTANGAILTGQNPAPRQMFPHDLWQKPEIVP